MKKYIELLGLTVLLITMTACKKAEHTKPQRKDIVDAVFASGSVFYEDEYNVISNTDGYLKKVYKRQGDSVKAGEDIYLVANLITASQVRIAQFNYEDAVTRYNTQSPTLRQKAEQVALAEKQLKKDSTDYARNKRLFAANTISQLDIETSELQYHSSLSNYIVQKNSLAETVENLDLTVRNNKKQLDIQKQSDRYNYITSEINGVLAEFYLNEGDLVTTGVSIAKISGGQVKARLYIDESQINRVKLGQKVLINLNTYTEKNLDAEIVKIYPSFDNQDQAFIAEADFINPPEDVYLFTQTQLQANIIIARKNQALVIPLNYLINKNSVLVKGDKTPRKITTGIVSGTWVEVLSGIAENDELMLHRKKQP